MLNEKFWKKYFKVYDILNIVIPYQELMVELEKELDLNQENVVLDVGSGTGNLMMKLKGKCKKIVGLDFSEEGIKIHKDKDPLAEIILCDITKKIPFSDNYFSKVVSNNVIYTLSREQQERVLSGIYRVLKPGGKFVVSNVKRGFSPIKIYVDHILKYVKKMGVTKTIILFFNLLPSTARMFYYNAKIKNSGLSKQYNFFEPREQRRILKEAGFVNVSEEKFVYSNQE